MANKKKVICGDIMSAFAFWAYLYQVAPNAVTLYFLGPQAGHFEHSPSFIYLVNFDARKTMCETDSMNQTKAKGNIA